MADEKKPDEPKQKTSKGYEVPVPKKSDFLENLEKIAKPDKAQ